MLIPVVMTASISRLKEKAYTSSFKTLQKNGIATKTGHKLQALPAKQAVYEVLLKKWENWDDKNVIQ